MKHREKFLLALILLLPIFAGNSLANPFDPSGYIEKNEVDKGVLELTSAEIYQVNRKRFMKLVGTQGSVVFPSPMEHPDVQDSLGLCGYHLKAFDEVLLIRKGLPVPKLNADEKKIAMSLLRRCLEGRVKGPTRTIETHDGVSVTIEPTKDGEQKSSEVAVPIGKKNTKGRETPLQK